MAVFRKSYEMVPIIPSQNTGSPMEEHQLTKGQKGVILGTLNPEENDSCYESRILVKQLFHPL